MQIGSPGDDMARFDNDFLRRIKTETDIVALIESYGTRLRPRGEATGEMIGLCPIHDDKNPSLVVNRKKNVWNCLGACGKGGDVIAWVMAADNVSFRHAVELLSEGATGGRPAKPNAKPRKLDAPVPLSGDDHELLAGVVDYYHGRLKQSPDALAYLQSRGITDAEAIERFRIGFVDRTLGLRLPPKQGNKAGNEVRTRMRELGITRKSGHEHLRGCVTFPLTDAAGQIKQIYGRRIDNKAKEKHFYLSQPMGGVLNREAFAISDEIILCESIIDALSLWSAGHRNVSCIYGVNGLTEDLTDCIRDHDVKRILIGYDNDKAGNEAAEKHAGRFADLGCETFRVQWPIDLDAAGFGVERGGEAFGSVIAKATWIGKGTAGASSRVQAAKEIKLAASEPEAAAEVKPTTAEVKASSAKASSLAASIPGVHVAAEASQPEASASDAAEPKTAEPLVEKQPPLASPQPPAPKEIEAEVKDNGIVIELGNRTYRVRGLEKNLAFDVLKLNVMVRRDSQEKFYVDTFDLYAAKARSVFIREAARELGFDPEVIKRDLGKVLLKLESLQDKQIEETLAVKDETIELTDKDKAAALELLKQPNLIERILADFDACGVVGEETNKLVGYLAATSRKLDKPLAVVIQSSSAAGKSSLMDAVLHFIPPEEQVGYSAMTGQSLFYMGGMNLQHKILSIAEEEGVAQASYALKLLQSEGQLTIASTGKDPGTGRMETPGVPRRGSGDDLSDDHRDRHRRGTDESVRGAERRREPGANPGDPRPATS